jgi:hypothetical protein
MVIEKPGPAVILKNAELRPGETLVRMLVAGLVLITIGMIAVMLLV